MIEDELNELPYNITRTKEVICKECHQPCKKSLKYELALVIAPNEDGFRYKLFYNCYDLFVGDREKYIGEVTGFGYKTISEAIAALKKEIKEV